MDIHSPVADSSKLNLIITPEDRVSSKKRSSFSDTVVCTACSQRLDAYRLDWMRRHPLLDVLLCKRCYTMHTAKEIQVGEDGKDEACRWCALEGDLICCDFCHNVFCKLCIRRNLGRTHLNIILNADEDQKWQCYVCNPEPLVGLVAMCTEILQAAEEEYDSKPQHKKVMLSPEDDGDPSSSPPPLPLSLPQKGRRGRKPGSTLPKFSKQRSLDMLKKEHEAASEAELDEIVGKMEEEENEEYVEGVDDPDFSLDEHMENTDKPKLVPPKDEVVYIKTPTGEIVALRASSAKDPFGSTVPKRPKGRPRIHPQRDGQVSSLTKAQLSVSSTTGSQGKKYPRSGSQYKNTPGSLAAMADVKLSSRPPDINEHNIWFVLEKLLASTQSMSMLLTSLKEDLKRATTIAAGSTRNPELRKKRVEVSVKLWRAFLAYKKSFVDLEISSKEAKSHLEMSEFYEDGTTEYGQYNEEEFDETDPSTAALPGAEEEEEEEDEDGLQQDGDMMPGNDQPMNGTQMIVRTSDSEVQGIQN